jgi:phosphoglycerate dehydrogenase-like enzyme
VSRILFVDANFGGDEIERAAAGPGVELDVYRWRAGVTIAASSWAAADGIVVARTQIGAAEMDQAPKCRIIVRAGVGFDIVDLAAAGARGIAVCNVPDYGTTDVADHAIAMMLTLTRGTARYDELLREDPVRHWHYSGAPAIRRLRGETFGVVGLGRIGTAAALRARAFGMTIAFYDPYLPEGTELALGFRRARSLGELLGSADVVTCHTPLTPETRHIIDAKALAAIKRGAVLVNTSRGGVVDPDAVYDALKDGRLSAAALDVLPQEPPSAENKLVAAWRAGEDWIKGRLILSPHAAFYSEAGLADLRRKCVETVVSYLRDGHLRNCVNLDKLDGAKRRAAE